MHDIISFVDREGNRGIRRLAASATDFKDLLIRCAVVFRPPPAGRAHLRLIHARHVAHVSEHAHSVDAADKSAAIAARGGGDSVAAMRAARRRKGVLHAPGKIFDLRTGVVERRARRSAWIRRENRPVRCAGRCLSKAGGACASESIPMIRTTRSSRSRLFWSRRGESGRHLSAR